MYIRNLRKPSPNKNIYKFASSKNKKTVMCEGSLEKDCCYHFEYDPEVICYESQPLGYYYDFCGQCLPYTPDFSVYYIDGYQCFIESKPYRKTLSKEFKQQFQARRLAANQLGFDLILVTERQIRTGFILENCKVVHRYSGCIEGDNLTDVIYAQLLNFKHIKISELALKVKLSVGMVFAAVLRLVAIGKAWVDLGSAKLDETTLVVVK